MILIDYLEKSAKPFLKTVPVPAENLPVKLDTNTFFDNQQSETETQCPK
jgi:hypothetical protein